MLSWPLLVLVALGPHAWAQEPEPAPPPGEPAPAPAPPAPAPRRAASDKFLAVGVSGDIGIFIRGLTIGTGGVGVYGSTGIGGTGGKAFFATDSGFRLGAEGGVDWDFRGDIDSQWWWVGGLVGVFRPISTGRYAGGTLGLGYGEGTEDNFGYKQEYFYFRPRTGVTQAIGPLMGELAIFAMLPIVLSQKLNNSDVGYGWTPWAGIELTIYFKAGLGS